MHTETQSNSTVPPFALKTRTHKPALSPDSVSHDGPENEGLNQVAAVMVSDDTGGTGEEGTALFQQTSDEPRAKRLCTTSGKQPPPTDVPALPCDDPTLREVPPNRTSSLAAIQEPHQPAEEVAEAAPRVIAWQQADGREVPTAAPARLKAEDSPRAPRPVAMSEACRQPPAQLLQQVPDIPIALCKLGLTAKEVFAGNGEQLPAFVTEAKLGDLLQQLWVWAVQLGKVQANAPVTVPRLVLVAQWGLQRMRAGAVQSKSGSQGEPRSGLELTAAPATARCLGWLGSQDTQASLDPHRAEVSGPASMPEREEGAAGSGRQQAQRQAHSTETQEVPADPAATTTTKQQQRQQCEAGSPEQRGAGPSTSLEAGSQRPGSCEAKAGGAERGLVGTLMSSWLAHLQSAAREQQPPGPVSPDPQQSLDGQGEEGGSGQGTVQRPRAIRPMPTTGGGAFAQHLLAAVGSQSNPSVSRPPQSTSLRVVQQHTAPADAGSKPPGGQRTSPPLLMPPTCRNFRPYLATGRDMPPAPHTTAAHSQQQQQQAHMLYLLGDLTGAELAEQPAFTSALQEVLRGFDSHLAAHHIPFHYAPTHLRQTCSFLLRNLDAQHKHWLAQDSAELFHVLLQACGLMQHMGHKIRELHDSVSRKVVRIAAAAAGGAGRSPAPPQPASAGMAGREGARGLFGVARQGSLLAQRGKLGGSGLDLAVTSSRENSLGGLAAAHAELAWRASSLAFAGETLQQQGSDPSAVGSAGSGESQGGEGSRGAAAQAALGNAASHPAAAGMAQQLLEIMRLQLLRREAH